MNLADSMDSERGLAAEIRERVAARPRGGPKANEDVYKMLFKGDITTGEGMIRLTERLLREFAAGKLPHRRFEAMLRAVRLIATMRRQFPAPPVDGPQESMNDPADALVVKADQRGSIERSEELAAAASEPRPRGNGAACVTGKEDDKAKVAAKMQSRRAVADEVRDHSESMECRGRGGRPVKRAKRKSRSCARRRSACGKIDTYRGCAATRSEPSPSRHGACKKMANAAPRSLSRKRAGEGVTRARVKTGASHNPEKDRIASRRFFAAAAFAQNDRKNTRCTVLPTTRATRVDGDQREPVNRRHGMPSFACSRQAIR